MKRKDFLINGGILGFTVLLIPQILSCKNKLHLEVLIGQGTDILKEFEKTGDESLSLSFA
ncbi:hypothetical protein [Pedobacter mendelii]|uniref:Uncharacterized protein n=1 Tax=Pedobacter mendelii TaxID=1908240 RepID=A0ABQ2BM57_9SPHI|nr:hypothetical protein [Pedobacter mendelii]GGI29492.1 hypothetical protein GCM10008119_37900 [Pedobacter mendelii]